MSDPGQAVNKKGSEALAVAFELNLEPAEVREMQDVDAPEYWWYFGASAAQQIVCLGGPRNKQAAQ
jgi:hypothetical protein